MRRQCVNGTPNPEGFQRMTGTHYYLSPSAFVEHVLPHRDHKIQNTLDEHFRSAVPDRNWLGAICYHRSVLKRGSNRYQGCSENTLHTERLILRPLTPTDSEELFAARSDQDVMAFWDGPPDTTPSETAAIVELLLADVHLGTAQYWCVRLQHDASL